MTSVLILLAVLSGTYIHCFKKEFTQDTVFAATSFVVVVAAVLLVGSILLGGF